MKQKGLRKVIVLLLVCLFVASWVTWENANEVFPINKADIYWGSVEKRMIEITQWTTHGLNKQQRDRLVDMLNQCQWEESKPPMSPYYDENRKVSDYSYRVMLHYQPEQYFWRKEDKLWLYFFKDNYLLIPYNHCWYSCTDTSGNYDALLELLEEQHFYCQTEHGAACQSEQQNNIIQAQLQLIAENQEVWESIKEYSYYYAVTDLNQNGRLELITSSGMSGTGLYTWSKFYEVDESLQNLELYSHTFVEGDSQPDIVQDDVQGYYDKQTDELWYVFEDYLKVSAEEYYESKNALCLKTEAVEVQCLARKETVYVDGQPQPTYLDMEGKTITEREYEQMEDTVFADFEKKKAHVGWREVLQPEEFWLLNTDAKRAELQTSYEAFSIN